MLRFIKTLLYVIIQSSWGLIQSSLGLVVFLLNINKPHHFYHGAIVTHWKCKSSVCLGLFIFVADEPYFYEKLKDSYHKDDLSSRLLIHEYGHSLQSLILGPLYLIVMGIPSTLWGFMPHCSKKRKEQNISYFAFFTERWANYLGEKILKQPSMGNLLID